MPNHVTNELIAPQCVLDAIKGPNRVVDFNSIVPMPEILRDNEPDTTVTDWAELTLGIKTIGGLRAAAEASGSPVNAFRNRDYRSAADVLSYGIVMRMLTNGPFPKDFDDKRFGQFMTSVKAGKETGFVSWYHWSNANWGTKWNAYKIKEVVGGVRFNTAWSPPANIIRDIINRFPNERICFYWADEDFGNNCGKVISDREICPEATVTLHESDSPEAHQLALRLIHDGVVPGHLRAMPDGRYKYVDEEVEA